MRPFGFDTMAIRAGRVNQKMGKSVRDAMTAHPEGSPHLSCPRAMGRANPPGEPLRIRSAGSGRRYLGNAAAGRILPCISTVTPNLQHELVRLAEELGRQSRLHAAIAECAEEFAASRDLYDILKHAVPIIRDHIGLDRVGIFLYDDVTRSWRGVYGTDTDGSLRDERSIAISSDPRMPIVRAAAGEGDEFFTEDFTGEFPDDEFMRGVKHHYFVTLKAHNRLMGAISVDNLLTGRPIDADTREDLRRFARYIALAMENLLLVDDLRRANQDLKDFAHVVSHDLKAPLRGVRSLADWMQEDYADRLDDEGRKRLDLMVERIAHLQELIDGILKYSSVEHARVLIRKVDCAALVRHVVEMLAPPPEIKVTVSDHLPSVHFDQIQLEQVFQNLIGNAMAHLGKPSGHIGIACRDTGSAWEFRVTDDGVGIPEAEQRHMFTLFHSGGSRPDAGSGVGLAVVRRIVEKQGGRLWVESAPGQGSAFFFTIQKNIPLSVQVPGQASGQGA